MRKTSLFLADGHPVVLAALQELLSEEYDVVGTATDGKSLIAAMARLTPELIIVDVSTPGMSGIELIRRLRGTAPLTKILILSVYNDPAFVKKALKAGAWGYVLKQSQASELFRAIKTALEGQRYFTPLISELPKHPKQKPELTLRQMEVLRLAAEGVQNKEIGRKLAISVKTVEYHKTNLMGRLNLHNAASLTRYAMSRGIV